MFSDLPTIDSKSAGNSRAVETMNAMQIATSKFDIFLKIYK